MHPSPTHLDPVHDAAQRPDVVVIGAGIAGLVAAVTAAERGASVVVVESGRSGGRARTAVKDGWSLNVGPHALYRGGHLAAFLAARGLSWSGGVVAASTIGVELDGRVHDVSMTPTGVLRIPVLRRASRVRLAALFARIGRIDTAALVGRTVDEWLGDQPDDLRQFLQMFLRVSTYTDAPGRFDAGAAVEQLRLANQGVVYLHGGWSQLVDGLGALARSAGVRIVEHRSVTSVRAADDGRGVVVGCGDEELRTGAVVLAAGGPDVAERLTGAAVSGRTTLTEPITASCLDLGIRGRVDRPVFSMDRPFYVSPHAPLADLAPAGHGLVCALHYLAPGAEPGSPGAERDLLRVQARLAGVRDDDVVMERALHHVVVAHGAPTAAGGGLAGRPSTDALGVAGVHLAGDWVGPHGLLADASSASGERAGVAAAAASRAIIVS
jgi:phytoene dehydrogenase-like protein